MVNGHVSVSDSTRSRVLKIIHELNYQPNFLTKGLSTNCSHLLGLVTSSTEHYGPAQVARSVERHARAHGYEVLLSSRTAGQTREITAAIQRMGQFGVDDL